VPAIRAGTSKGVLVTPEELLHQGDPEAAMAAHAIYHLVHPGEALHFEYSTSKGVPA